MLLIRASRNKLYNTIQYNISLLIRDVFLTLVPIELISRELRRTEEDDISDAELTYQQEQYNQHQPDSNYSVYQSMVLIFRGEWNLQGPPNRLPRSIYSLSLLWPKPNLGLGLLDEKWNIRPTIIWEVLILRSHYNLAALTTRVYRKSLKSLLMDQS